MAEPNGTGRLRTLSSVAFTLLSILVISYFVEPGVILATLIDMNPWWLAGALLVFLFNYALRTARFAIMLDIPRGHMSALFGVTAIYGMLNYLLPAKSGELTYPVLARRHLGLTLSSSSASLVAARLLDFITLSLYLPLVLASFWAAFTPAIRYSLLAFCLLFYCIAGAWFVLMSTACHTRIPAGLRQRLHRLLYSKALKAFSETLIAIHTRGVYRRLFVLTLLIWFFIYLNFYMIVRSLGYDTSLFQMITVSAVLLPLTLIPLQGVANIGSHEIAWVTAMSLYGYSRDDALAISLGTHAVLLLLVLVLGAVGYLLIRLAPIKITDGRRPGGP